VRFLVDGADEAGARRLEKKTRAADRTREESASLDCAGDAGAALGIPPSGDPSDVIEL
jgi:hypothetical protein